MTKEKLAQRYALQQIKRRIVRISENNYEIFNAEPYSCLAYIFDEISEVLKSMEREEEKRENRRKAFLFGHHPIIVSYQVYKHYVAFNGSQFWSRHRTCWR